MCLQFKVKKLRGQQRQEARIRAFLYPIQSSAVNKIVSGNTMEKSISRYIKPP